jgi:hypothetical protein
MTAMRRKERVGNLQTQLSCELVSLEALSLLLSSGVDGVGDKGGDQKQKISEVDRLCLPE